LLDRTFVVYRSRFWLFAGISALSGAVQLVTNALTLLAHHVMLLRVGSRAAAMATQTGGGLSVLFLLLATAVTEAATVYALGEVYLSRPTSVADSLRATIGQWYRYAGIAVWQGWSMVWVALLLAAPAFYIVASRLISLYLLAGTLVFLAVFGGGIYGVIAYLRNSLAVPSAVIEHLKLRPAMRRSKVLAAGTKGRLFLIFLIVFGLSLVAGAIQTPLLFFIARTPLQEHVGAQIVILSLNFLTHTLISPVALIGLSLVYFDQRVRREGLDVLMLLGTEEMGSASSQQLQHADGFAGPDASREVDGGRTDVQER
jgi:hypothetical protein